jgi:tetratricopeptide (TPR) repeat protein
MRRFLQDRRWWAGVAVMVAALVAGVWWGGGLWAQEPPAPVTPAPGASEGPAREAFPPGAELALVEQVVDSRQRYEEALAKLVEHYTQSGQDRKLRMAQDELEDLRKVSKYDYVTLLDVLTTPPKPIKSIPEADRLFADAMTLKNYPADLFIFGKRERLEKALSKFQQLIVQYPESDKVAEAAYRMAEIYEGPSYNEYFLAARYFEAAFQWNPKLPYPALWRAAQNYDSRLQNYVEAKRLYEMCVKNCPDPDLQQRAQRRLQELKARGY